MARDFSTLVMGETFAQGLGLDRPEELVHNFRDAGDTQSEQMGKFSNRMTYPEFLYQLR